MKRIYIFLLLLFFLPGSQIFAVRWAVLPASTNITQTSDKTLILTGNPASDGREIARLIQLYMILGGMNNVIPAATIEKAVRTNNIPLMREKTPSQLSTLAVQVDADRILLPEIHKTSEGYQIESNVFFLESGKSTDPIVTRHKNLWKGLGVHLRERFPQLNLPFQNTIAESRPVIFILDASGNLHSELSTFSRMLSSWNLPYAAVCAESGSGTLSHMSMQERKISVSDFISRLSASGGTSEGISLVQAMQCAQQENPFSGNPLDKPDVFFLAGNPVKSRDNQVFRSSLRQLAIRSHSVNFILPAADVKTLQYWENTAAEISSLTKVSQVYIRYLFRAGLANGTLWQGELLGNRLKTVSGASLNSEKVITYSQQNQLLSNNGSSVIEEFTGSKVVDSPEYSIDYTQINNLRRKNSGNTSVKTVKLLLEIENINVWIELPQSAVIDSRGNYRVKAGEKYYFVLNMLPPKMGMPFVNDPSGGVILSDSKWISRLVLIDTADYFKNPQKYLNGSIDGLSLYAFYGTLKLIRGGGM